MTVPTLDELKDRDDHEIESNAVPAEELAEWTAAETCNGFAFSYLETHDDHDVVVKQGLIRGGATEHCWVFDATRGVTIDATLRQFNRGPAVGVWVGDRHPHHVEFEGVDEWSSREAFREEHDEMGSDFIV